MIFQWREPAMRKDTVLEWKLHSKKKIQAISGLSSEKLQSILATSLMCETTIECKLKVLNMRGG